MANEPTNVDALVARAAPSIQRYIDASVANSPTAPEESRSTKAWNFFNDATRNAATMVAGFGSRDTGRKIIDRVMANANAFVHGGRPGDYLANERALSERAVNNNPAVVVGNGAAAAGIAAGAVLGIDEAASFIGGLGAIIRGLGAASEAVPVLAGAGAPSLGGAAAMTDTAAASGIATAAGVAAAAQPIIHAAVGDNPGEGGSSDRDATRAERRARIQADFKGQPSAPNRAALRTQQPFLQAGSSMDPRSQILNIALQALQSPGKALKVIGAVVGAGFGLEGLAAGYAYINPWNGTLWSQRDQARGQADAITDRAPPMACLKKDPPPWCSGPSQ